MKVVVDLRKTNEEILTEIGKQREETKKYEGCTLYGYKIEHDYYDNHLIHYTIASKEDVEVYDKFFDLAHKLGFKYWFNDFYGRDSQTEGYFIVAKEPEQILEIVKDVNSSTFELAEIYGGLPSTFTIEEEKHDISQMDLEDFLIFLGENYEIDMEVSEEG